MIVVDLKWQRKVADARKGLSAEESREWAQEERADRARTMARIWALIGPIVVENDVCLAGYLPAPLYQCPLEDGRGR